MLHAATKVGISLGLEARKIIDEGDSVRGDIITSTMKERTAQDNRKNGLLLDGFPRMLAQTEAIAEVGVDLDTIARISVPGSVTIDRISGRRARPASDRAYHVTYSPPKIEGKDDVTGEDLIQRGDDRRETVEKRLVVYHEQTEVLVDFYSKLEGEYAPRYIEVDGTQPVEVTKAEASSTLGK